MEKKSATARRRKTKAVLDLPAGGQDDSGERPRAIIGMGASAGGLPALELFLRGMPTGSGLAFVVVQHLDPSRKGMMAELLQRSTGMNVSEAQDGMQVCAGEVYVIPPNADLSILHGVLQVLEPPPDQGLRLPIDFFLTSLAQDMGPRAIGVILSGMGSDGTAGLRAIRERGGFTAVQDPDSAEFDSMPRSVVVAGLADLSAPAEDLAEKILVRLRQLPVFPQPPADPLPADEARLHMDKIVLQLRAHTGHDFSFYKRNTLHRRVERRMGLHQIEKLPDYLRYLRENPQELSLLFKELLIGVTSFFRDPEAWEQLRREVIPALLADRPAGESVRAWVPGCSTGEEAYSLAIIIKEAVEEIRPRQPWTIQVFATDIDQDAIDKARTGWFPPAIASDLTPERLNRFFVEVENGYRVGKDIREMVIFAPQNLIMDPPFTNLDILSCRNLLIYLTPEVQKKLIPLFHYSLRPGGVLFQGSAETIGDGTDLFSPKGGKARLYQKKECLLPQGHIVFPASLREGPVSPSKILAPCPAPASLQTMADRLVLQRYAPPAVLTNDQGDILYVSGRTRKHLEPAAGKANWNVLVMAHESLRYDLTAALRQALGQNEAVLLENLPTGFPRGSSRVDISVQRLDEPGPLQGLMMIVFQDAAVAPVEVPGGSTKLPGLASRIVELEQALVSAHAEARVNREEMQTSQEELRSANEELQSSNEELMTSKEEMQSMNEELHSVNTELQATVDDLSRTSSDMKNLLDSTDIATLFLDRDLNVQRFTPQATRIIKLIPGDAGRPITDLVSDLSDKTLAHDAQEVLRTLIPAEKSVSTDDGRWFTVRIMPYRTNDHRIDGVVITFADITVAKTLEAQLRQIQSSLEQDVQEQTDELSRRPPLAVT